MDIDIKSIQEARGLLKEAESEQKVLASFTQEFLDSIVENIAITCQKEAERLAKLAHKETGYGVFNDKVQKNLFASKNVYENIKDIKTVGVISKNEKLKIIDIAEPMGIVVSIVPTTNPTSTTIDNALKAIKARNSIVFSPHPKAKDCTAETVKIIKKAIAEKDGPEGIINCLTTPHIKGTQELMTNKKTALILATGGEEMVRSAHSAGKPAIGVGPGNVPVFIERTADIKSAVRCIVKSKTFDNGMICASEQSIIIDKPIEMETVKELENNGCYILKRDEVEKLSITLFNPDGTLNPELIGQSAYTVAKTAGINVDTNTTLLIAPLDGVGPEFPLSREKLSPVVALFIEDGWEKACIKCIEVLEFMGLGHTLIIHSNNPDIIMKFGLEKPAFRILVNAPGSQGAIGLDTGLPPAMTLGCGTWGGSITSDNITPHHLMHIKRVAFNLNDDLFDEDFRIENSNKNSCLTEDKKDLQLNRDSIEDIVRDVLKRKGII
jgi:acetaldehyde dehydrogenase (acetylating)